MPLLNEYLKLRNEQARELTWGELDANFLYVANPWSPQRHYIIGNIVYYYVEPNTSNNFQGGYSWYVANADNGPVGAFNITNWDPIGAATNSLSQITVINGLNSDSTINTLDFLDTDFTVSFNAGVASITANSNSNIYWLTTGDPLIGTGNNSVPAIHTGNVVIGSGTFPSTYTLAVYGTTNITGNLTVGGTINSVPLATFYTNYGLHSHTAVPVTSANYAALYPTAINALADFNINAGTLAQGHTLSWDAGAKKWINIASTTSSLAGLTDVTITAATDLQMLIYNSASSKWINTTIVTDGSTGFSTPPLIHNHDTRYYTKTNLQTTGQSIVNWNNLSSLPQDPAQYIVAAVPTSVPFAKPNYRVLGSADNSVTITNPSANTIDLSVNTSLIPSQLAFQQNSVAFATATGLNFIDTTSAVFNMVLTGTVIDLSLKANHAYYLDNVSISNRPSVEFLTPTLPFVAGQPNVWFTPTDNPGSNDRTQITAIARPGISINTVLQASPRQVIGFDDTATIGWTATDDSGNDRIILTADFIGTTGAVEIQESSVSLGTFPIFNFIPGLNATWTLTPGTGIIDVSVNAIPNLAAVTFQGNTTPDNMEITTPADVATYVGGLILTSPIGNRFLITVDDVGNLITTLVP